MAVLQRARHHDVQGRQVREGLVDVVEGPGLHGPDGGLHVVEGRDEDDAGVAAQVLHLLDDVQAGAVRQLHVEDDHAGHALLRQPQPLRRTRRGHHLVARLSVLLDVLEVHLQGFEQRQVVIDDEKRLHGPQTANVSVNTVPASGPALAETSLPWCTSTWRRAASDSPAPRARLDLKGSKSEPRSSSVSVPAGSSSTSETRPGGPGRMDTTTCPPCA